MCSWPELRSLHSGVISTMAAHLVMHLDAVHGFLQQIEGTPGFKDVIAAQRVHFEQMLGSVTLSVNDAKDVVASLRRIPWPNDVLNSLVQQVTAKMASVSAVNSRARTQDFTALRDFFTSEQWSMLMCETVESSSKLEMLAHQAGLLESGLGVWGRNCCARFCFPRRC